MLPALELAEAQEATLSAILFVARQSVSCLNSGSSAYHNMCFFQLMHFCGNYSSAHILEMVGQELFILRFYESPILELQLDTRIMGIELGKKICSKFSVRYLRMALAVVERRRRVC